MSNFKLGLVTVLFNSDDVLEGFFKSLSIQSFKDFHLYLIDNTPNEVSDNIITTLTKKYDISEFTHIRNTNNVGVATGNNQGIKLSLEAGTTHTLLLNNDIEFEQSDLLYGMYNHAVLHNEPLTVPKILFYESRKIWTAGGHLMKIRATTKHIGEGDTDGEKYDLDNYSDYAPTCFMLIDNVVFNNVGLIDDKYFVYYDDTDFIYRAVQFGYKIYYLAKYTVLHKVGSLTGGDESVFTIFWSSRNRIYFIRKNYNFAYKVLAISFTLAVKVSKAFRYSSIQRKRMIEGLIEGFKIKVI